MNRRTHAPTPQAQASRSPASGTDAPGVTDLRAAAGAQQRLGELADRRPAAAAQAARISAIQDSPRAAARTLPVQRVQIDAARFAGLPGAMDTSAHAASKQQIDTMWESGRIAGLKLLMIYLLDVADPANAANNQSLAHHIAGLVEREAGADADARASGWLDRKWFDLQNPAADRTGITRIPGRADVLPRAPTALQQHALAVRSWQIGDILDSVSWSTLGAHLQGRMDAANYEKLGNDILAFRDLRNGTNVQAGAQPQEKIDVAHASLQRVTGEVRGGLDGLPKRAGESYRSATTAPNVYGNLINVGDHIKDMAFWSTSGLKMDHRNVPYGAEGKLAAPMVYYLVTGQNGVFLPGVTNTETGVREILYKNETVFRVTRIVNYGNRTYFVRVVEVDPATLPPHTVTKNPWSGADNP